MSTRLSVQNISSIIKWLASFPDDLQDTIMMGILNAISDGVAILDEELRYTFLNQALLERIGRPSEELMGKSLIEAFPSIANTPRYASYLKTLKTGVPATFDIVRNEEQNAFLKITAFKLQDGLVVISQDLSRDVSFENTILELYRHAYMLQNAESVDEIYNITLDVMENMLGFASFDILIKKDDYLQQVASRNLPIGMGVPLSINGVTVRAFKNQKTVLVNDLAHDEGYYKILNPETHQIFDEYPESKSELATPIILEGESIGILNVESTELERFTERDAVFLEILAIHVASAIKRLRDVDRILEQESQFTNFAENSQDAIWIYKYGEGYEYFNPAFVNIFGCSKDEILADQNFVANRVVSEDRRLLEQEDHDAIEGTLEPSRYTLRFMHPDGVIRHIEQWTHPLKDKEGKIIGIYGSSRDITAQIAYRENLRALNEHASKLGNSNSVEEIAQTTMEILKNILKSVFASFQIVESDSLKTILTEGFPPLGWNFDLNGPGITSRVAREKRTIIIGDTSKEQDFLGAERQTNSELAAPVMINDEVAAVINIEDVNYDYYTNEDKQFVELLAQHVASAMERIKTRQEYIETQQKLIEERVKLEKAREMDEIKTRFISTAAHEIRTPMTSIKGYTEIIGDNLEKTGDQQVLEYFHVITRNLERLELLTNDLLDLQRIETNKMSIQIIPTSVEDLVEDVKLEMLPLISEKEQRIEINQNTQTNMIPMDKLRIHQVLINFISNASKYSPKKTTITLTIEEKPSEIEFHVKDQGRGINAEDREKLFKPFPDIIYRDMQRGTGLGLAICKGIIELHNGRIWVESDGVGEGSTFSFTLPKRV